jgi:hypothetical protein
MKIKRIKKDYTGTVLSKDHSIRGKQFEQVMSRDGWNINQGPGADLQQIGIEVKTKDVNSGSANSVGTITVQDICSLSYKQTHIFEKLQKQFRITTADGIVTNQDLFDFTDPYIQEKIEEAYEIGRQKIINGDRSSYIRGSEYGHFEQRTENSYVFRIPVGSMKKIESMSKSTFNDFFEYK